MLKILDALLKAVEAFIRGVIGADISLERQDLSQGSFWVKIISYGLIIIALIFAVVLALAVWESRSSRGGGAAILYMAAGLAVTLLLLAAFYFFTK